MKKIYLKVKQFFASLFNKVKGIFIKTKNTNGSNTEADAAEHVNENTQTSTVSTAVIEQPTQPVVQKETEVERLTKQIQQDFSDHFEFGMYGHFSWYAYPDKIINYEDLKNLGIDFVYESFSRDNTRIINAFTVAQKAGVKILVSGFNDLYGYAKTVKKYLPELLTTYKDTFYGAIVWDEPHLEQNNNEYYGFLNDNEKTEGYSAYSSVNKIYTQIKNLESTVIEENQIDPENIAEHYYITNMLPNYAQADQCIHGTWVSGQPYVDAESYEKYVDAIANSDTSIIIGDFYGPSSNEVLNAQWPDYLRSMRNASIKYNKPLWQYVLSSTHNSFDENNEENLKYRVFLNMIWGAQAIIYYRMLDSTSTDSTKYTDSAFDGTGNIKEETYNMMQLLMNNDFKNIGGFFKNSVIDEVDFYNTESETLPLYIDNIISGTLCIAKVTKNEHKYLAIFSYTDAEYTLKNLKYQVYISKNSNLKLVKLNESDYNRVIFKGSITIFPI